LFVPPDTPVEIKLPARSSLFFMFGFWEKKSYYPHPNMPPDGAGSLLQADNPIQLLRADERELLSQTSTNDDGMSLTRLDFVPTQKQRGTEYVYVPYQKTKAIRKEDYVRILAYKDGTSVSMDENTTALLIIRGEIIDTLLDRPCHYTSKQPCRRHTVPYELHVCERTLCFLYEFGNEHPTPCIILGKNILRFFRSHSQRTSP